MRQIFHSLPWIPPEEPQCLQTLYKEYGVPMSFRSGQLIKGKGEENKLFFITNGCAAYYIADTYKSHPNVLNLLIPNRAACDLSALTETKVNVTTRAIGKCDVLAVPPHIVRKKMLKDAPFATEVAKHVLFKQECSIEAMVANFTIEPAIRLRTFLKVLLLSYKCPINPGFNDIPVALTTEQYGNVVNLTRVSVSRLFSEWISQDLLQKNGKWLSVKDTLFEGIYDWFSSSSSSAFLEEEKK